MPKTIVKKTESISQKLLTAIHPVDSRSLKCSKKVSQPLPAKLNVFLTNPLPDPETVKYTDLLLRRSTRLQTKSISHGLMSVPVPTTPGTGGASASGASVSGASVSGASANPEFTLQPTD